MYTEQRESRHHIGRLGESFAEAYLTRTLGWTIVARNWRSKLGEVDIVAFDGTYLIVVEVRTRSGSEPHYGTPEESIRRQKLLRLNRLANQVGYQFRNVAKCQNQIEVPVRIDVIALTYEKGEFQRLQHLRSVSIEDAY